MEATARCCERWGVEKVTVDDIARESGVSRATLYRVFPGGRVTLFEARRVYEAEAKGVAGAQVRDLAREVSAHELELVAVHRRGSARA